VEPQPKQEGLQPELGGLESEAGGVAGTGQIPDGFVLNARDVDRGEVSRTQQARDLDRVSAVVLDLVARLLGDHGRCDDLAGEPLAGEVPMEGVPARAGLVGEDEIGGLGVEPSDQLVDVGLAGADGADEVGRIGSLPVRVRDGDRILVDVQADEKKRRLFHG
jgi:hypothetical protein